MNFEARFINIRWRDKTHVGSVKLSAQPIDVESVGKGEYCADIISYSTLNDDKSEFGQFAVRPLNNVEFTPFILNGTDKLPLQPVVDFKTGLTWWVEKDKWDKDRNQWQSRMLTGVGSVILSLGPEELELRVAASTFTYEQLDRYLSDFKLDFSELLLDDESYLTSRGKLDNLVLNEDIFKTLDTFVESITAIVANPKVDLIETLSPQPRGRVRPTNKTFIEYIKNPYAKSYSGRVATPTTDNAENRYAHFMLKQTVFMLGVIKNIAQQQYDTDSRKVKSYQSRIDGVSPYVLVNAEAVVNAISRLKEQLKQMQSRLGDFNKSLSKNNLVGNKELFVHLTGQFGDSKNRFFAKIKSSANKPWHDGKLNGLDGYNLVLFSVKVPVEIGCVYRIVGNWQYDKRTRRGKSVIEINIRGLHHIDLLGSDKLEKLTNKINSMETEAETLAKNGWKRPLRQNEKTAQQRELASLQEMHTRLREKVDMADRLTKYFVPFIQALKSLQVKFERLGIGVTSNFPSSMTYIQNRIYSNANKAYKSIINFSGFNEDNVFEAIQKSDNLKLINISSLYERWCLLQFFKVLIFKFRYQPEKGWKEKLIASVLNNEKDISISFTNKAAGRDITLWYEKILSNRRTPDFLLEVNAKGDNGQVYTRSFVFDAKFYQDINDPKHGGISEVIKHLYFDKDYSEKGQNGVFVLHPSNDAVPVAINPQSWAQHSFLGEITMFDWDNAMREQQYHRYGAIKLSPIDTVSYLDELQRLVGMCLQYGVENNKLNKQHPITLTDSTEFCIQCGGTDLNYSQGNNDKVWWATCNDCKHFTIYSYCSNSECRTRLIKNGDYWNYHSIEALKPINIQCPACSDQF